MLKNNVEKVISAVEKSGLDAVMITSHENLYYTCGFSSTAGEMIVTGEEAALFIDSRYFEEAEEKLRNVTVYLTAGGSRYYSQISDYLKSKGIEKLGIEEKTLSYDRYRKFSENLGVEFFDAQYIFENLRACKEPWELDIMIEAQRTAEKSFLELMDIIDPDMTEKEVATELLCLMLKNGADDRSFDPIVVSGAHSSVPHGEAGDNKLQKGFLTIDFGCKVKGYCSDTTRTLCIGEPTEEMVKVYNTVLEAQLAGIAAARAGLTGKELDWAARAVIENAGYGKYFSHSFSHGLGVEIHEFPTASPLSSNVIPAGAVMSAEPGIYIPGKFGVRIEDVLYITEDGAKNITDLSKQLFVINA